MVLVSVIIPVYQVSDYVERCLISVMNQSYKEIECIIVNDSTRDDSIEKCEQLIADYSGPIQFRILHHDKNRGLSAARNTGTKAERGEWIFYIDSDDEITPDCIQKLMSIAQEHPDAEMVLGNTHKHYEDGRVTQFIGPDVPTEIQTNAEVFRLYQQRKLLVNAWNILINKRFIKHNQLFFKEGIIYEDRLWLFFVVKVLSKLYICKDITYHYYLRPNSIITGSKKHTVGTSYSIIYNEILHHLTSGGEKEEMAFYVEGFCRHYMEHKKEIPNYNSLMKMYRKTSRKNGCWSIYSKLCLASVLGTLPFGLNILQQLRALKSSAVKS